MHKLTLDSPARQRHRAFLILFLIITVNLLGFGIIIPLLPFYGDNLKADAWTIGWIFASYSLSQMVAAPFLGDLSDRYGRRPVLIGSLIGTVISFALLAVASSIPMLFVARIIDGLSGGNIPTARAYISDITAPEQRAGAYGLIGVAFGLGFVFGPALAGVMVGFGLAAPAWTAAALALLATVITIFSLPETVHDRQTHRPGLGESLSYVSARSSLMILLAVDFLLWASVSVYQTTFSLFANHRFHYGPREVGYVLAWLGFLGALVQGGLVRRLVRRTGEKPVLCCGLFCTALGLYLASWAQDAHQFVWLLMPAMLGSSLSTPSLLALLSRSVPADQQGRLQGVSSSLESLGRALGPVWGNGVLNAYGEGPAWRSAAFSLVLTGCLGLAVSQPGRPSLAQPGAPDKPELPGRDLAS